MRRRGRPAHSDILTPRQWEVLKYLRDGLPDQEIAERMSISLDGAKYHVSEILSKLGVTTREKAAAWTPAEHRRPIWQRALAMAATLSALAIMAGVGVLALSVATNGEADEGKYVSRDAALLIAGSYYSPAPNANTPGTFTVQWLPPSAAAAELGTQASTEGAWKAVTLYETVEYGTTPTECLKHIVYIPDEPNPVPQITDTTVPPPCGSWDSHAPDNLLSQIGTWISWRSGSPAPRVLLANEMAATAATAQAGLSTPRPFPSELYPDATISPGPSIWLVHVVGDLPKRSPQLTGEWDKNPNISCQDLYFGMGEQDLTYSSNSMLHAGGQFPVIDESTPSHSC